MPATIHASRTRTQAHEDATHTRYVGRIPPAVSLCSRTLLCASSAHSSTPCEGCPFRCAFLSRFRFCDFFLSSSFEAGSLARASRRRRAHRAARVQDGPQVIPYRSAQTLSYFVRSWVPVLNRKVGVQMGWVQTFREVMLTDGRSAHRADVTPVEERFGIPTRPSP